MTTIFKFVAATIMAFLLSSCNFNMGIQGNGNVVTAERSLDGSFSAIDVSKGIELYLTQGDIESISVQADENLHDIITTKVEGNVLKITTEKNVRFSEAMKVMVSFKTVDKISASSGSDVVSSNTVSSGALELDSSSGSEIVLDLNVASLTCDASSGSDQKLTGKASSIKAQASSGSTINASGLMAETSRAKASSGGDISVNVSNELFAEASSGGNIKYSGNPSKVEKDDAVSGSISQQQ